MKKKTKKEEIQVVRGSGNVFADLNLPNPETRLAKAELVRQIHNIIKRRRLTQAKAAKLLGIDQPKISALLKGRLGGFSTDRLLKFLTTLEQDIEIIVRPTRSHRQGTIAVHTKGQNNSRSYT